MALAINESANKKRFEVELESKWAFIDFIRAENKMYLTHTEVPPELEGKGIGSSLVKYALQQIKDEGRKLVPLCPFVAAYLKRHPEYHSLLASGYSV